MAAFSETRQAVEAIAGGLNAAMATDWGNAAARALQELFERAVPTATDKAMDAAYNATRVGGNWHRLFDGGHSLLGSWQASGIASPGAALPERLSNWGAAYWNDLVTVRGMPLATFSRETVANWEAWASRHLGTDVGWVKGHLCFNAAELAGALAGLAALAVNWRKGSTEKSAQLAGSFIATAALQTNPLLSLVAAAAAVKAAVDCVRTGEYSKAALGLARGAFVSAVSIAASTAFASSGSLLLTLLVSVAAGIAAGELFDVICESAAEWRAAEASPARA